MRAKPLLNWLPPIVSLSLFAIALWVLHDMVRGLDLSEMLRRFRDLPAGAVLLSLAITVVSYLVLTSYDLLALRHIGRRLAVGKVLLASFVSYVFSHNIGMALVTGGGVRYRVYTAAGLNAVEIGAVTLLCALTFTLGAMTVGATALMFEPASLFSPIGLGDGAARPLGAVLAAAVIGWIAWAGHRRREIRFREATVAAPGYGMSVAQIVAAIIEMTLSGLALYVLLPPEPGVSFVAFIAVYILATVGGIVSHVPGGIGVIEATFLLMLPQFPPDALLASILAFRVIYLIIPLFVGAGLLAVFELAQHRKAMGRFRGWGDIVAGQLLPAGIGTAVVIAGAVMMMAAVRPNIEARLVDLLAFVPVATVELAHVLAAMTGLGLVVLGRSLFRRLRAAHASAAILLGVGIGLSLAKGLDYEVAGLLAVVLALLSAAGEVFNRPGKLSDQHYPAAWVITIAIIVGAVVWVGAQSHREIMLNQALWLDFSFREEAPRTLRAIIAMLITVTVIFLMRQLHRAPPAPDPPVPSELDRAAGLIASADRPVAGLAVGADRRLLFGPERRSLIVFAISGKSWIGIGEPIGPAAELPALLWEFWDRCEAQGERPLFYNVGEGALPLFADIDLNPHHLGDEAVIAVDRHGVLPAGVRASYDRLDALGARLTAVPEECRQTTAAALNAAPPDLLAGGPWFTVVLDDEPVAYAAVATAADRSEMLLDHLRIRSKAPDGTLDFLIAALIRHGRDNGFARFNLGLCLPAGGHSHHPLRPLWRKGAAAVFPLAGALRSVRGTRSYAAAFAPEWRPKYLVGPEGREFAAGLDDVAVLYSNINQRLNKG